jgi:hypothetical protein
VVRYTRETLVRFSAAGATPDMVQIGNEINNGMMWPDGRSSDWDKLADLLKAGIRGVDSAAPPGTAGRPQIMIHIACGGDTAATKWFFDNAASRGIAYDAIGQSYYPLWHGTPADLGRNLEMMGRRYAKDIWVVETIPRAARLSPSRMRARRPTCAISTPWCARPRTAAARAGCGGSPRRTTTWGPRGACSTRSSTPARHYPFSTA